MIQDMWTRGSGVPGSDEPDDPPQLASRLTINAAASDLYPVAKPRFLLNKKLLAFLAALGAAMKALIDKAQVLTPDACMGPVTAVPRIVMESTSK